DLAVTIAQSPSDWFSGIRGVGLGKATRIQRFLGAQLGDMSLHEPLARAGVQFIRASRPTRPAFRPMLAALRAATPAQLNPAAPSPTLLLAPSPTDLLSARSVSFSGASVSLRAADDAANLMAHAAGYDAMQTWLRLKASPKTTLLYRREVERLILWCVLVNKVALTSMSVKDAVNYRDFMLAVPREWISRKGPNVDESWAPFAGALCAPSARKALVIIGGFFSWLVKSGGCAVNPFDSVKVQSGTQSDAQVSTRAADLTSLQIMERQALPIVSRALPHAAIEAIEKELALAPQDDFIARARFVFRLAHTTGLRISELAAARRDHLTRIEPTAKEPGGWLLSVLGKRAKVREVPISDALVSDLSVYLCSRGLPAALPDVAAGVYLIGRLPSKLRGWSNADGVRQQTVHILLTRLFRRAANRLSIHDQAAAKKLSLASAH
ncbi:MAG: tyrosine-type recombinase/integrase, partial [Rhodoferax sp.]